MTLSKTARILIAIMLAVMAVFVWVNFFFQGTGGPFGPTFRSPSGASPLVGGPDPVPAAGAPSPAVAPPAGATRGPAAPTVAPSTSAAPAVAEVVGARDLEVAELPFLVTEPPAAVATEAPAEAEATGTNAERPQEPVRITVNPFSPVLVAASSRAVAERPVPTAPAQRPEPNGTVAAPGATPVAAPAPRALTPRAPTARNLPRRLPGGTLPIAPDLLEATRPVAPTLTEDLASVAAIREPNATGATLQGVAGAPVPTAGDALPEPIAATGAAPRRLESSGGPLAAGVSPLSRYLRDNDFRFTGSVLGPVSVGVFRSALAEVPVVIALGQTLPDTDIVLTDLRGHQAEFTLNDISQILTLDLRR